MATNSFWQTYDAMVAVICRDCKVWHIHCLTLPIDVGVLVTSPQLPLK